MDKKETRFLLVISDTHCGSDVGLAPVEFKTGKGNIISHGSNALQAWLWATYQRCLADAYEIIGKNKFNLLINGDVIEGIHHRSPEVISTYWEEHLAIAEECLAPVAKKANETYVVKGTECHTLELENTLADRLGAVEGVAKEKWLFEMCGNLIDATHHISATGRSYLEGSALSIFMGNARQSYARAGHRVPEIFIRAHRHTPGYFTDGRGCISVTGAFQGLTRYAHKVVPDAISCPSVSLYEWKGFSLPTHHLISYDKPQAKIRKAN